MTELLEEGEVRVPTLAHREERPRVVSKDCETVLIADLDRGSQSCDLLFGCVFGKTRPRGRRLG
jgi:hypothetical protein